jgi:hypothetical protein
LTNGSSGQTEELVYDCFLDRWRVIPALPSSDRLNLTVCFVIGKLVVCNGFNAKLYIFEVNKWREIQTYMPRLTQMASVVVKDEMILFGGFDYK